jgi:hypothetical protein
MMNGGKGGLMEQKKEKKRKREGQGVEQREPQSSPGQTHPVRRSSTSRAGKSSFVRGDDDDEWGD